MIKLLLGRILPMALAGGLLTSALSPLKPALQAFGVAADALSGNTDAGGSPDLGKGLALPSADGADPVSPHADSRRRLEDLAASLNGNAPKLKTFNEPKRPKHTLRTAPRAPLPRRPSGLRPWWGPAARGWTRCRD